MKKKINVKAMMAILLLGGFMALVNETILNVALTKLMVEMNVTAATIQWLSSGYVLIVAIMVLSSALLMNTFTTKQLYLGAMIFFIIGTILAVIAINFPILLAARMIQAVGSGLLIPIMTNSALSIYPQEKHGFVIGICTCVILMGPALGPIISGIILQFFSWRALFIMMIPILFLCTGGGAVYLQNTVEIKKPKIDYLSIILSSVGFALIVYGMSIITSDADIFITILIFVVGILALALFCKRQLSSESPILNIRTFRKPYFTLGIILTIIMQMVQFSMNIILPMLLENGLNLSSFQSALILLPAVLICSIMSTISGKIYDKIGGKTIIPLGILIMFIFLMVQSHIHPSTSIIAIAVINMIVYFGISLAWSPNQSYALNQLELEDQTHGVAIFNTSIQLGAASSTPLFVGLMTVGQNNYLKYSTLQNDPETKIHALYSGFSYSITVAAVIVAIAFILSLTLRCKAKNPEKV